MESVSYTHLGKGLVTVAAHAHAAAGADLAAGTGAGRDGVTGGAAAIAGKAGYDGRILGDVLQGIAAHCAHALAVYGDIGNVIAGISGDGEVLTLAAVHLHCSRPVSYTHLISIYGLGGVVNSRFIDTFSADSAKRARSKGRRIFTLENQSGIAVSFYTA